MQPQQTYIRISMKPNREELHIRLCTTQPLRAGNTILLLEEQSHYLATVMRKQSGEGCVLFNGVDGEWVAQLSILGKKQVQALVTEQLRPQIAEPDLWFCFAPLKHQKNEKLVAQATELGANRIVPVKLRHGIVDKIHTERFESAAIEAAEQSERLSVPQVAELQTLAALLKDWPKERLLIVADESGGGKTYAELAANWKAPAAVLIGPEGGFAHEELALLRAQPFVRAVGLGPRILKADTAAITLLSLVAAQVADWQKQPAFRAV